MLDQNTDRMWYVIGAVIIGAAIILILNNTFPQLFASIGETFQGKTEDVTEITDGIAPIQANLIEIDDIVMNEVVDIATGNPLVDSIEISTGYIKVEAGKKYVFSTPKAITKRVSYFSDTTSASHIKGERVDSSKDWVTTAPAGAIYARISADYTGGNHAAIEDWHFGRSY